MLEIFFLCPKSVKEMEKEELGGKNGFGAEKNRDLSKLFLNRIARFYFNVCSYFFTFTFTWLLMLTILSTESCLLFYVSSTGSL